MTKTVDSKKTYTVQEMQAEFRDVVYGVFFRLAHDDGKFAVKDIPIKKTQKYTVGELEQVIYSFVSSVLYDREVTYNQYIKQWIRQESQKPTQQPLFGTEAYESKRHHKKRTSWK